MVLKFEIFNHAEFRVHKAYFVSKATCFNFICLLFSFILPVLFLSPTRDFWITEQTKHLIPSVKFKNQVILNVIFNNKISSWSNIPMWKDKFIGAGNYINVAMSSKDLRSFTTGLIFGAPVDRGFDVNLSFQTNNQNVSGIQFLAVVDYSVTDTYTFKTQGLVHFDRISAYPGQRLLAVGQLRLDQKRVLPHASHLTDASNVLLDSRMDMFAMVGDYLKRNFTVMVPEESKLYSWSPVVTNQTTSNFIVNIRVRLEPSVVRFRNTLFHSLKFAWLQYVSFFLIFSLFFDRVRHYVFSRRLLSSIVIHPTPSQ